jgi:peptide/nickel transport system substrate-binding protein
MGRWSNPRMDELIQQLQIERDAAKRDALAREALLLAAQELPLVTIHQPLIPWAMRKNVSAWFSPVNTLYFYRVRVD